MKGDRLNFDKADPPREVIDSFRDVQAAEQERDTLEKRADAYANQTPGTGSGNGERHAKQQQAISSRTEHTSTGTCGTPKRCRSLVMLGLPHTCMRGLEEGQ